MSLVKCDASERIPVAEDPILRAQSVRAFTHLPDRTVDILPRQTTRVQLQSIQLYVYIKYTNELHLNICLYIISINNLSNQNKIHILEISN